MLSVVLNMQERVAACETAGAGLEQHVTAVSGPVGVIGQCIAAVDLQRCIAAACAAAASMHCCSGGRPRAQRVDLQSSKRWQPGADAGHAGQVLGGYQNVGPPLAPQVRASLGRLAAVVAKLNHNSQAALAAHHCQLQMLWEHQHAAQVSSGGPGELVGWCRRARRACACLHEHRSGCGGARLGESIFCQACTAPCTCGCAVPRVMSRLKKNAKAGFRNGACRRPGRLPPRARQSRPTAPAPPSPRPCSTCCNSRPA